VDGERDAALELVAQEYSDKQQLRRALLQLVESCRALYPDSLTLAPALIFAQAALDDTSHEGWLRRMRERRQAELAERAAECERGGHPEVERTYMGPPRCTYCEQFVD